MKILSINKEQTRDENTVAFNVDSSVTPQMVQLAKIPGIQLELENNVLLCLARLEPGLTVAPAIDQRMTDLLNYALTQAEQAIRVDQSHSDPARDKLLRSIAERTGLAIE